MEVDFAEIIKEVDALGASDLHMTVGAPPMVRVRGELKALDFPILGSGDTRDLVYGILSNDQRKRLENEWQVDFSYSVPLYGPLPRQRLHAARVGGRSVPLDPDGDQVGRATRAAGRRCTTSPGSHVASCSSPVRPDPASRRRWRR